MAAQQADVLPSHLSHDPPYQVEIQRSWLDEPGWRALLLAENVYPSRDKVIDAIRTARLKAPVAETDTLVWWWTQAAGMLIPYAITTQAVEYYLSRVERYREGGIRSEVRFRYVADVELAGSYAHGNQAWRDVYVIRMHLAWWDSCGALCGVSFSCNRTVVVDQSGQVLLVDGDGNTSLRIS